MNTFLPKDYEAPKSKSNYLKFEEGTTTFRVLSPAIVGWEYWTKENKPVRSKTPFEGVPENAKLSKNPNTGEMEFRPKHFWAFVVINRTPVKENEEPHKPQILQLTQKSIQDDMFFYINDEDWGDPKSYDFVVTRTGKDLETKYQTGIKPKKEIEAPDISHINLEALYEGKDPFGKSEKGDTPETPVGADDIGL